MAELSMPDSRFYRNRTKGRSSALPEDHKVVPDPRRRKVRLSELAKAASTETPSPVSDVPVALPTATPAKKKRSRAKSKSDETE